MYSRTETSEENMNQRFLENKKLTQALEKPRLAGTPLGKGNKKRDVQFAHPFDIIKFQLLRTENCKLN